MPATQSAEPPPMIVGEYMCLSIVVLVIKFHYRLEGRENTTYVVKPSFTVQDK